MFLSSVISFSCFWYVDENRGMISKEKHQMTYDTVAICINLFDLSARNRTSLLISLDRHIPCQSNSMRVFFYAITTLRSWQSNEFNFLNCPDDTSYGFKCNYFVRFWHYHSSPTTASSQQFRLLCLYNTVSQFQWAKTLSSHEHFRLFYEEKSIALRLNSINHR